MKYILFSKRKNPKVNVKVPYEEELLKYAKPGLYVHFSDLNKVGINPKSMFNTPIGIYTYPVKEMYKDLILSKDQFAHNRKFAHILKAKGNGVDVSTYTKTQEKRDLKILKEKYGNLKETKTVFEDDSIKESIYSKKSNMGYIWTLTREIADILGMGLGSKIWAKILHKDLGYDYISDLLGTGTIYKSEPLQCIFFSIKSFDYVTVILNDTSKIKKVYIDNYEDLIKEFKILTKTIDLEANASRLGDTTHKIFLYYLYSSIHNKPRGHGVADNTLKYRNMDGYDIELILSKTIISNMSYELISKISKDVFGDSKFLSYEEYRKL